MINYYIHDGLRIVRSGSCDSEIVNLQAQAGEFLVIGELPYTLSDVPDNAEYWDVVAQTWVTSNRIYITNALMKRAQLLQASDWTQLPDVPLATKEAWAVYRQALRDITLQAGYPLAIDWPLAP